MQSKTSFSEALFNGTLFRKNLTRFWPLWAVYGVIWTVMLPLFQFTSSRSRYWGTNFSLENFREYTLRMATDPAVTMALIFGILFAVAMFSYLCNPRAVGMVHSFPIRREGLFLTNYLSGLFMQLSALVAAGLLTLLVQVSSGVGTAWKELALWLAVNACLTLFFYSFGVFCAMFSGQILAIPAFYGILNILAVGVETLVRGFSAVFLYGATGGGVSNAALWLSPVVKLYRELDVERVYSQDVTRVTECTVMGLTGMPAVWICGVAALVLTGLALVLYRLRRSESAGDTVSVGWAKPLFTYGVAVCAALGLGQGLYYLTWGQFFDGQSYSLPAMLACMLCMELVGYFGAEMLLRKSFRILKPTWKGAVALSVVLVLFGAGLSVDIIGFESHIPPAEKVESVYMTIGGYRYLNFDTEDRDIIARVEAAHQAIVSEKGLQKEREQALEPDIDDVAQTGDHQELVSQVYVELNYYLKNGSAIHRRYNLRYTAEDVAKAESAAAQLSALFSDPQIQRDFILDGVTAAAEITGGDFGYCANERGGEWKSCDLTTEEARAIFAAVNEDIAAGRMGKGRFLYADANTVTYNNNVELYVRQDGDNGPTHQKYLDIPLSIYCTATIAALKDLGIVNEERALLTEAQTYALQGRWEDGEASTTERPDSPAPAEPEVALIDPETAAEEAPAASAAQGTTV